MDPLQNDMANISIAFETDSLVYFEATLRETRINLNCLTENGLNLFHMLASDKIANEIKALQYLEILVKEYKDRYFLTEVSELLREAVNKVDDRTYMTPLMLAVLKKRKVRVIKRIIHQYIELGACFDAVDNEGRNVCHYAAYSGNNYMLALLKFHYRVDVDIQDRYGRTPLHVAILRNKVDTAKFLMVVSRSVNVEDMEGLTPFGYAIIVNSYTIAKHLLINRAEKLDLNSQNRVPMHFLNPKSDIIKHLVFQKGYCWTSRPIVNKSFSRFIIFILFMMFRIFQICYLFLESHDKILLLEVFLVVISTITAVIISRKKPEYVDKNSNSFLNLYDTYKKEYVCVYCISNRDIKDKHCNICNRCVKNFDHHCLWIRNCIGKGNIHYFSIFLITLTLDMILGILYISCIQNNDLKKRISDYGIGSFDKISILIVNAITLFYVLQVLFYHVKVRCILWNKSRKIKKSSRYPSRSNTTEMILVEQSGDITPSITTSIPLLPAEVEAPNRKRLCCC